MKVVKIENWKVVSDPNKDPYKPPEALPMKLSGEVYGHPNHKDGTRVVTSRVCSSSGRMVATRHNMYLLGEVDPDYYKWIQEKMPHVTWDDAEPIKLRN